MSIVKARGESWLRIDRNKTHQRLRKIKASSRVLGPIVFFLLVDVHIGAFMPQQQFCFFPLATMVILQLFSTRCPITHQ
jgi:hypothetical protein